MAVITISRQGSSVVFTPSPATISKGDVIVFRNEDPQAQHQPTLQGQAATFWFPYPMAPFVAGQPADTSDEVFFGTAPLTVTYVCAIAEHTGESGTIVVQ